MRNTDSWRPTKFVEREGRLRASRDKTEISIGSRLMGDIIASHYGRALPLHARGRLLDLGCGRVPLYATYLPYVDDVTCVDWGNSPHSSPHVDVECDLTQPLP